VADSGDPPASFTKIGEKEIQRIPISGSDYTDSRDDRSAAFGGLFDNLIS